MNRFDAIIENIMNYYETTLAPSTLPSRKCYLEHLKKCAEENGFSEPCQELYNLFLSENCDTKSKSINRHSAVKQMDAFAQTHALKSDGTFINPLPTLTIAFSELSFPVRNTDIRILIQLAEKSLKNYHLSDSTLGQYTHAWNLIMVYFFHQGSLIYDENILDQFLAMLDEKYTDHAIKKWRFVINRRASHILREIAQTGIYSYEYIHNQPCCKNSAFEIHRNAYIESLQRKNLSVRTIINHDAIVRRFLDNPVFCNEDDFRYCTSKEVEAVILEISASYSVRSMGAVLPVIRSILDYFYKEHVMENRLSGMVVNAFRSIDHVANYISAEDEPRLLAYIEKQTKRNKAIILLALRLGIRSGDITDLKFSELDWKNDKIRINQQKTGQPLVLPLLSDVGNALMDYILHERFQREDNYPYVFLMERPPHKKLNCVYAVCAKAIHDLNIQPVNGNAAGVHLYRYTLVHRLLEAKVPHQVITDTLGHTSHASDKPYISMEDELLRDCALDLSEIPQKKWKEGESDV